MLFVLVHVLSPQDGTRTRGINAMHMALEAVSLFEAI